MTDAIQKPAPRSLRSVPLEPQKPKPFRAWLIPLALVLCTAAHAQQTPQKTLRVAIKPLTPFVMPAASGAGFEGYSVDLWNSIAAQNGWKTEYILKDNVQDVLNAVKGGQADAGISGISITKEREAVLDFSVPMFNAGLQVLVPSHPAFEPLQALSSLFSPQLEFIGAMILAVLVIAGHVIWLTHRHQPDFPKGYLPGVLEGMWWGVTNFPQNSLGDKNPKSWIGRLLSVVWLVLGVALLANFTASVTANMTVQQIQGSIHGVSDLPGKRVLTVKGTTAEAYLVQNQVSASSVAKIEDAFDQLESGKADAVVYDAPVLQYFASHDGNGKVAVVGDIFKPEYYGIALPNNSALRKQINQTLTDLGASGALITMQQKWFGNGQ